MNKLRLLAAAVLVIAQLPLTALAGPLSGGISEVSTELLLTVTGGACTSCHNDSHPPPNRPPDAPRPIGNTYWELTRTQQIQTSHPGYHIGYSYRNNSAYPFEVTYSVSQRQAFSWSITAGVPSSVVSATLGRSYDTTTTRTIYGVVGPRMRLIHYVSHPTDRYQHTYTRFQDWSDGSREVIDTGSAASSRIYPDEFSVQLHF